MVFTSILAESHGIPLWRSRSLGHTLRRTARSWSMVRMPSRSLSAVHP